MNATSTSLPAEIPARVVLFDGVCAVCDTTVQWILDHDPEGRFAFAPLQGDFAAAVRARHPEWPPHLDSIVLVEQTPAGERLSWHSNAILGVASGLDAPWRFAAIAKLVPAFLRDPFYRAFAAVRYRVFGTIESCRMPREGEETRFLA